jgi:hypothetical protein
MYSTSYSSNEAYENASGLSYWIVGTDAASELHECHVAKVDADIIVGAARAAVDRQSARRVLERCFEPALPIRSISVEARQVKVDWDRWRLNSDRRVPLTDVIPADAIR